MRVMSIAADDNYLMVICCGDIHDIPKSPITDDKIAIANSKIKAIFEELGFEFCDCESEEKEEIETNSFAQITHIDV